MAEFKLTPENYYTQEANRHYLSKSVFTDFEKCEVAALAKLNSDWEPQRDEKALLVGNYLHSYFESPEAHQSFLNEDKGNGTNADKMIAKTGKNKGKLKADFQVANAMIDRLKADEAFNQLYLSGQKEVIVTGEIHGVPWMGKIDSLDLENEFFYDIKTSKDLHEGAWVKTQEGRNIKVPFVQAFSYDLQMAVYRELIRQTFGVTCQPLIFAVSKQTPCELMGITFDGDDEQALLDAALERIEEKQAHIKAVIDGKEEAVGCGKCEYCRGKSTISNNLVGATQISLG